MKLLRTLHREDFHPNGMAICLKREAVRAVIFDQEGNIPILYVSKENYYKLPGGGIEQGETKISALYREIMEETGCSVTNITEIGEIDEFRKVHNLLQKNYCYLAKVAGKIRSPAFTAEEQAAGFELLWLPLSESLKRTTEGRPQDEAGTMIRERDLIFLQEAKKLTKERDEKG